MKRVTLMALVVVVAFAVYSASCMDRAPAPVCPVPTEVNINKSLVSGFDGVDMLVVVDNSGSMEQEQAILSTGFFTLINSLVNPMTGADWPYPEVANMRVAVVSSDLGLQYGDDGSTEGFPYGDTSVPTCTDQQDDGDDGRFQTGMKPTVSVESGRIKCADEGLQCPADWNCEDGECVSPSGDAEEVNCPQLGGDAVWAETTGGSKNQDLAAQVACLAQLGTKGCGVEQQLESSVRGLSRNSNQRGFMKDTHLLAVLIVSDEEDCSIKKKGLFNTAEWKSGTSPDEDDETKGLLNTACNLPQSNETDYLFPTNRYWTKLVELKDDQPKAVVFAAIVGVPTEDDAHCQGTGNQLTGCLDQEEMELKIQMFTTGDSSFRHFRAACERKVGDETVTSARPGRRYVKVAQEFGANGYVYSICNENWSPAMKDIARVIAENIGSQCYAKKLDWVPVEKQGCDGCGEAKCDVVVTFEYNPDNDKGCPSSFKGNDPQAYEARVVREKIKDNTGSVTKINVHCPLPKLPAPLDDCAAATVMYQGDEIIGWYYCENQEENFEETCGDGIDNDGDGTVDCDDEGCQDCQACPDGTGVECKNSCKYGVELTTAAKNEARGRMVQVQCLQQFSFEDENCQENSYQSCNDNEDNDGNGIWDCNDDIGGKQGDPHFADPHCCPMVKEGDNCKINWTGTNANCPGNSQQNPPDACAAHALMLECMM